ncbi:hypothetical protein [Paenibacillus pini]|uniref:Uncharacterized protein n=1 Tax=Paenibacillus pini JCM 16418 TaxID=1236976 RepID=W7YJ35_9BACL|nr:hypothetical protein [Paenibacillus pini]GAF07583.1 hypothetical protein JCM16418_1610 [Paenibacillus pini JCM 16418]
MAAHNKPLQTASSGTFAPQHFNRDTDNYEYSEGKNGALFVAFKSSHEEFVFIDKSSTAGIKDYTVLDEKTINIPFISSDPVGTKSTLSAFLVDSSGNEYQKQGIRQSGVMDIVDIVNTGEVVTYSKPAGFMLRIKWQKPTGAGTVSAKAVIVQ